MNRDALDSAGPDRYLTADGALTADGDGAGEWLDTQLGDTTACAADWDTLAGTLEVHPRVARHLHFLWCADRDCDAAAAQHALF